MTTTFEWRINVFTFVKNRSFFFFKWINVFIIVKNRLFILFKRTRRQTRTSTRIERKIWFRRRRIDDLTLRRWRKSAFFFIERLVKEIIEWSTFFIRIIFALLRFFFVFCFIFIRRDDVVLRDICRLDFLFFERFRWFVFINIFILFEAYLIFVLTFYLRFVIFIIVVIVIFIVIKWRIINTSRSHNNIFVRTQKNVDISQWSRKMSIKLYMICVFFFMTWIYFISIFFDSTKTWCKFIFRNVRRNVSTTFFHRVVVWLRMRNWVIKELWTIT